MQEDYWEESTQPLTCLAFVAPLLVLYECGVLWAGSLAMRNGADVWLRAVLARLGFSEYFFLPLVTCGCLLGWHHLTRKRWQLRSEVLAGMVCESFGFGVCVLLIALLYGQLARGLATLDPSETGLQIMHAAPHLLSFLGAGIYEELLFRLGLLSGSILLCRRLGVDFAAAVVFGVVSTSLLFAAAHYRLFFQSGLDFTWYSFTFRVFAGTLFSVLYLHRGFGVVVGTHAIYDILVATLA